RAPPARLGVPPDLKVRQRVASALRSCSGGKFEDAPRRIEPRYEPDREDEKSVQHQPHARLKEQPMTAKVEYLLPTAKELLEQIALAEAEKAAESMRKRAEAEAEKKRLLDTFSKPSLSDEEAIRQGIAIIQRAAKNGQTEVQVFRFPNELCTDHGRAINQTEPGWESTLTGVPKQIYQLW